MKMMNIFILNSLRFLAVLSVWLISISGLQAQDSTMAGDSLTTNQDAVYNRPFIVSGQMGQRTAYVGGYVEGNTNYFITDGITDGFSMELRRFNMFLYAAVSPKIKFLSELEFEHGTEEIALEMAMLDFKVHSSLVLRGGILLPPVGYFNQNHDGPRWEFVERPLVSTTIIPATLSEMGFGLYGKIPTGEGQVFTYQAYMVNGLGEDIVGNNEGRTSLQAGKHASIVAEDNNGIPSFTGRTAFKNAWGEFGVSYYGGVYNSFRADGIVLEPRRPMHLYAFDYQLQFGSLRILGEAAGVTANVPSGLDPRFGEQQWGMHTDVIYPVLQTSLLGWRNVTLNALFRGEYIDYNAGTFPSTGDKIYDELTALVPGVSLRFTSSTVLRFNYRYHWRRDLVGNPPARTAGFQFGFASYF